LKFPLVLKASNSSQGKKVYKSNSIEEIGGIVKKTGKDISDMVIQEFIDYDKDIRLLVIGDEVVGAMRRVPKEGEFRANFSLGGSVEKYYAPEDMKKLAISAAKSCDLEISGIDILVDKQGDYHLLEANRTPGLAGISKALGFNVADKLVDYIFKVNDLV
jgi:RimK family alpha-L-glutamate ligase